MEWTFLSEQEILEKMGGSPQAIRLERNITQKDIAEWSGASLTTVQRLEKGKPVSTEHFVRILRALDMLEKLELMFPEALPSPVLLKKMRGKKKYRARKKMNKND